MKLLEERWSKIKGVRHLVSIPNRSMSRNVIFIVCDREEDSGVPVQQIARTAFSKASDLPFKAINPIQFPLFGTMQQRSNVVDVRVRGESYEVIDRLVKQIMEIGKNTKGIVFRYTDLYLRKPQIEIRVDDRRATHLGFEVKAIADAVEAAVGGQITDSQYRCGRALLLYSSHGTGKRFHHRFGCRQDHSHITAGYLESRCR